ncbi:MAG: endo-1,3-alpha-glucanase family glycosylhydrolase [Chloroflexota bacterium]|nr:endo-1,3-alpha-glucanase family glycosylhydrolase [Chloroflexota bacterium]
MRQLKKCWGILLLLGLLLPVQPLAAQTGGERLVVAFYYAWFDWNTWGLALPDQPTQPYLSADPTTIERHVVQAQQAGLDALVLDWLGPQVENNQTETNMRILLDKAVAHGLKAALTVDIAGPFINNQSELVTALTALRDTHAAHPGYLRADGRPVVFFWRQNQYSVESWLALRQQIDPQHTMLWIAEGLETDYLRVFDGLYLYSVAWSIEPDSVLLRWGSEVRQWSAAQGTSRYWVATTMPGYDDYVTGRADAFVQPRDGGNYYRTCWRGARESGADMVAITSFNEWLEGTYIEPSHLYGDTYLNLTAQLANEYRQQSVPPTATPAPPTVIPPTATPVSPTLTPPPTATLLPSPTATFTPTVKPTAMPTATLTPTATPFRLPTPTPTESGPLLTATATEEQQLPVLPAREETPLVPARLPVNGSTPPRSCSLLPVALLFIPLGVVHLKRVWYSRS